MSPRLNTKKVDYAGHPSALVFNLKKDSPYSYKCQVCSACCYNKAIRIAPYEALRLSRNLGLTTTQFYSSCSEEGGTILLNKPDGSCVFLGSRGCSVHPDRPLVCRLFPLGQITDGQGVTKYASMPLHPDCLGVFDMDGTVESYLEAQGTEPYFYFDRVYSVLYKKMTAKLSRAKRSGGTPGRKIEKDTQGADPDAHGGSLLSSWLDVDAFVDAYCRRKGRAKPETLPEIVALHIAAVEDWLAEF